MAFLDEWEIVPEGEKRKTSIAQDFELVGPAPSAKTGLLSAEAKDPDKFGKVLTLADALSLPVPVVEDDFDHVNYWFGVEDYGDLGETHPATASILSDPKLAAVAKDDIESLKKIEETLGYAKKQRSLLWTDSGDMDYAEEEPTIRESIQKMAPETYKAWLTGWVQQELAMLESQALVGKTPEDYGERLPVLEQAMKDLNASPVEGFFDRGYSGAVQMLPQLAEQARVRTAGGLLGGTAGAALAGFGAIPGAIAGQQTAGILYSFDLEGGLAYNEFKKVKDADGNPLPDDIARGAAIGVGAVNAALEVAQFNTLLKLVPGGKALVTGVLRDAVTEGLKKETTRQALASLGVMYAKTVGIESVQETAQRFVTILGEEIGKKISGQAFEGKEAPEIGKELLQEFEQAVGSFMFLAAPGAAMNVKPALDSVEKAKRHGEFFDALNESLNGNITRDRYSPAIRALVERVKANASAAGEEVTNIGVPATALNTMFQENPEELQAFLQAAEIEPGAYSTALEQERDVEIPLEVFAQNIAGTPLGKKLVGDLRLFPGDATANEAKQEAEYLKSVLEKRATEGLQAMSEDAELKSVIEGLKGDVRIQGMTKEDADAQLSVLAARAKSAAVEWTKAGKPMSAAQWITEHVGLQVQQVAEGTGDLEQAAQEMTQSPEFQEWFGESRVVDESGKPLVVYHGTSDDIAKFNKKMLGSNTGSRDSKAGFWFTSDPSHAAGFNASRIGNSIIPVMLAIKNPLVIDHSGLSIEEAHPLSGKNATEIRLEAIKKAKKGKFDGVVFKNTFDTWAAKEDGSGANRVDLYLAFEPAQIKSIFNRGTFDKNNPNILMQSAYHGTPYRFDKFSLSHIGKGEGAQAFGWGLYFASSKDVAEFYRRTLSEIKMTVDGLKLFEAPIEDTTRNLLSESRGDIDAAIGEAEALVEFYTKTEKSFSRSRLARQALDELKDIKERDALKLETGQLYKVDLPDDDNLLVWDKPLKDQPEKVKEAYNDWVRDQVSTREIGANLTDVMIGRAAIGAFPKGKVPEVLSNIADYVPTQGQDFYESLSKNMGNNDQAASEYLHSLGILGHKYLEGSIGGGGKGGYNYVIYDEEAVKILETFYQNQQSPLGSVTFDENQTVIKLFKSANFSTFLHEIGHVFMIDLENLIATGNASEQARLDLETLKRFTDDEPDFRAKQEKLARAFETYLLEGKAPTRELQSAFQRFRSWLSAIYRNLKSVMGIELNEELRGVFDRLLMAEDEIENAITYHNVRSSLDALIDEVATDAEKAKIEKLKARRTQDAIDKRVSVLMKAYFRAIGGRAGFQVKAEQETAAEPVYEAIKDAAENGGLLVPDDEDQAVRTVVKRHGPVASTAGKINPEILAAKHGFESGQALIKAMRKADSLRTAANRRAKELFTAEEAKVKKELESETLASQYGVTFPGDAEFHTEAALDLLVAEAELLRRKRATTQAREASVSKITARALRDRVRADLEAMPVREALRYEKASAAEARASRAAEASSIKGDIEEALRQKQLQAYYHAMVLESVRAREEMGKLERRVARFLKGTKRIDGAHREQFLALANRYELTDREPADLARLESFESFVTAIAAEDPNGAPVFSAWLLRGEKAGPYRNLTLAEARELRSAIEWVVGRGSDYFQQLLTQKDISIATYADKAMRSAQGVKTKPVPLQRKAFYEVKKAIRGGIAKITQPQFYLRTMDGFQNLDGTNPGLNEDLFLWLAKAGNDEKRIFHGELWPKYREIFKTLRAAQRRIEKERGAYFELQGVPVTQAMLDAGIDTWTSEYILSAALNMGNDGNRAALLQGFGLTENQLQILVQDLTAEDWDAIQGMWDLIDTQYKPMDDAYFAINNIHTQKVEARLFTAVTKSGAVVNVRGGYYPLIFDHRLSDRAEKYQQEDLLKNSQDAVIYTPAAKSGFTNKRTGGLLPPKLSLSVIPQHLYDTVHYYTHAATVQDIDRITRVPEWKQEFIRINGKGAYDELRPWLKSIARPDRPYMDAYDSFMSRQRALASIAILGLNAKSAIKQTLAFFPAMRDLGIKYVAKGLWASMGSPIDSAAEVRALSPYMAQRRLAIDREMREVVQKALASKGVLTIRGEEYSWDDVKNFAFAFIEVADAAVTIPTWKAAYAKAQDLAYSPEESIAFADNAVRTAQASADIIDQVALQRSTNWTRLFSMFMSDAIRSNNRMRYFWGAWRNGGMQATDYFRHVLYELFAPGLVRYMVYAAFLGALIPEDDEDKAPATDLIFNTMEQILGGFPILNMLASAIEYGRGAETPVTEGLTRAFRAGGAAVKATRSIWDDELTAEEEWVKFAIATADIVSFEAGIGYAPRLLKTFAEGFEDLSEGETSNPLRLIIKVPKKDR